MGQDENKLLLKIQLINEIKSTEENILISMKLMKIFIKTKLGINLDRNRDNRILNKHTYLFKLE